MKELGYDMEFCIKSWFFAPKDTPQEAIDGFAAAIETAADTDRFKQFLTDKGFGSGIATGDDMAAELEDTWKRIEPVAKLAAQK